MLSLRIQHEISSWSVLCFLKYLKISNSMLKKFYPISWRGSFIGKCKIMLRSMLKTMLKIETCLNCCYVTLSDLLNKFVLILK